MIVRKAEDRYLKNEYAQIYRYYDDTVVSEDEYIYGNMVIVDGNLKVRGKVEGDILVMFGDVRVYDTGRVYGNITTVDGEIRQSGNSLVTGYQLETSRKNIDRQVKYTYRDYSYRGWRFTHREKYSTLPIGPLHNSLLFRYNRVQGFFIGYDIPKSIGRLGEIVTFHGYGGYGFVEKKFRYQIGLDRYFFNRLDYRFELGGKLYDLTDTRDAWYITPLENTLAAALFNTDYQDFYRRKGFEFHASQNFTIFLKGALYYRNDNYYSLSKNTDWALFGKGKQFRDNPEIDEGSMRSLIGELYLDTRNDRDFPFRGWYGRLSMEVSNAKLHSDFYFNQYIFELRHYISLSRSEQFDFRIKIGSAEKDLPRQKLYEIGGYGTLRGFYFKEFNGDRLILGNFEYKVSIPNPKPLKDFKFILFADVGDAWYSRDNSTLLRGFEHLKFGSLKSNIGIGLSDWKGRVRINLAKRTDRGNDPLVVTVRLARPF